MAPILKPILKLNTKDTNMKIRDYYSQELRDFAADFLEFDFKNGEIYWKKGRGGQKAGTRAGGVNTDARNGKQYRQIGINGKLYLEHRLLYCFFHKDSFMESEIDHIDQNGLNNAIDNLRDVTRSENSRNQKKYSTNTSGVTGVYFNKTSGKWRAEIKVDGKMKHLGYFEIKEDAIAARQESQIEHNFHKNHGT
jgi:hypothetical protein